MPTRQATRTQLKTLWRRAGTFAKALAIVQQRLSTSAVLGGSCASLAANRFQQGGGGKQGDGVNSSAQRYLQTLRAGAKHADSVIRALGTNTQTARLVEDAQRALESHDVVATVETAEELEKLEMWQQGDISLATEEKLKERQALRYDRRVLEQLQRFWEAAQNSIQSSGDDSADSLNQEGHAIMLRRICILWESPTCQPISDNCPPSLSSFSSLFSRASLSPPCSSISPPLSALFSQAQSIHMQSFPSLLSLLPLPRENRSRDD